MREIEGIETIVRNLEPHWGKIEEHFKEENEKFRELLNIDHDIIGRVLKCHLIVENYLERYLTSTFNIDDIQNVRLSFYQKAVLLPSSESSAAFVKPGILKLNSIRNKFAHNLDFDIDEVDLGAINEILEIARQGVDFDNEISKIEAFTTVACTWLIISPPEIDEEFQRAFEDVRVHVL